MGQRLLTRSSAQLKMLLPCAGGRFVKWTGDGFIAWFDVELHRELGERSLIVFRAAWHITFLINVTQLGLSPKQKFRIRHGIAFEQDALLIHITHPGGYKSLDLIGRAVVLASRLSSVPAHFPNIVTQGELVRARAQAQKNSGLETHTEFCKWPPSPDDLLKYFKNERWGTQSIYISCERKRPLKSLSAVIKQGKQALNRVDGKQRHDEALTYVTRFVTFMAQGPKWCEDVMKEEERFIREGLEKPLRQLLETAPKIQAAISERQEQERERREQQEDVTEEPQE